MQSTDEEDSKSLAATTISGGSTNEGQLNSVQGLGVSFGRMSITEAG